MLVKVTLGVQVLPVLVNCHCTPTICAAAADDQFVRLESVVDTFVAGGFTTCDFTGNR
jgi:hypothetical protein